MPDLVSLLPGDPFDEQLRANVHPRDWVNPTPAARYNLVVIGAGTAGLVTAAGAAGLGAKVALVERELMGGDCLNVGCVPSKALLRSARALAEVRRSKELGIRNVNEARADFPAIMARLRRLRADLSPNDSAARFRSLGVDVFLGAGQFAGADTLQVAGHTLRFARAVIATGARAARPAIPGLADAGFFTNETIFTLTDLPARLVVIGAGPIGCEMAQAFARFGTRVTLIGKQSQVLPREDQDAATLLESSLAADGVVLMLGAEVTGVRGGSGEKTLFIDQVGLKREVACDAILVAAGRAPNVEGLNLEAAGVGFSTRQGVQVNDRLRTTNRRIYAAGDCCSPFQFTHAADATARIAIRNALFFGRARVSQLHIPWCTYTDPEVAHIGLTERQAHDQGVAIDTYRQDLRHVDRAILDSDTNGFVKVHVLKGKDRIVGATVVARHAGDMISEITLALQGRLGLGTLAGAIHPYPTQAEAIKKTGDAYFRTRLTPWLKWLFAKWFAWTR